MAILRTYIGSNSNRIQTKTRENAVDEYLDYQIPVTQLKGAKGE